MLAVRRRPGFFLCSSRFLLRGLFVLSLGIPSQAQLPESYRRKLSPHLPMLVSGDHTLINFARARLRLGANATQLSMISVLVQFQGSPQNLNAPGLRIRTVAGTIATADLPESSLELLARCSCNVIRIEEDGALKRNLNTSVVKMGANRVWGDSFRPLPHPWSGNTGRDTIIGIVDPGGVK